MSSAALWIIEKVLFMLVGAGITFTVLTSRHDAEVSRMLSASAQALQIAQEEALARERESRHVTQQLEIEHAEKIRTMEGEAARLRRAIDDANARITSRVCDSGKARSVPETGHSDAPTNPSGASAHGGDVDRLLRAAVTSDRTAEYANLCHKWVQTLRSLP